MKRKIWKTMTPIIAATMMFSMVAQANAAAEPGSATQEEAAENYTSMSKNDYIDWLLNELTNEEKCAIMQGNLAGAGKYGVAGYIQGVERLNIGNAVVADGEEGINTNQEATQLPAKVLLASTWSEDAAYDYGSVMGSEANKLGVNVLLTPRVNIVRDSCSGGNGGNYQTYGEDPLLNGILGAGEARGLQDQGVIANLKQMFGSSTGSAQGSTVSIMNEQTMREVYLQIFDIVIDKADVAASMTNYSTLNNVEFENELEQASAWNWNTILREQMGFDGFIEPDWGRLVPSAYKTGVDWDPMPFAGNWSYETFLAAVEEGTASWEEVDKAVRNILISLYDYGMLSPDFQNVDHTTYFEEASLIPEELQAENDETAKNIAVEGSVLLKNDNDVLPLSEDSIKEGKVAFIGYNAKVLGQPSFKEASCGFYDAKQSPIAAVAEQLGVSLEELTYYVGADAQGDFIPVDNLKFVDEDGNEHRGLASYTTQKDEEGNTVTIYGDICEDFTCLGEKALAGEDEEGVHTAYNYTGKIYAEESGEYRINVVQKFPDDADYKDTDKTGSSGTLTVNGVQVGVSTRMSINGAPNANSCVLRADMGDDYNNWNLCGGYITLEAGQWYDISFTVNSIYGEDIEYALTWVTPKQRKKDLEEAVSGSEKADTAVVFVWQDSASQSLNTESLTDITYMKGGQIELVDAVAQAYENVVVVCNNGDAFNISSFKDEVDSILEMWWPGQAGGKATAEILLGKVNPSGKLPVSFAVSEDRSMARNAEHQERYGSVGGELSDQGSYSYFTEGIDNGYRTYIKKNNEDVVYEFGYGLSYTTFEWSDYKVDTNDNGGYDVSVTVTNTGDYAGKDVVQVYLGAPENQPEGIQFSDLTLAGFAKTKELQPGESETLHIEVMEMKLSYWDSGEIGSLTAEELEEMMNLGGTDAAEAKAQAAEWYSKHNPDYEGEWRVAEGERTLYVMTSADWDSEAYSEKINVKAKADVDAELQGTVQVPITVEDAEAVAVVNGMVSYDADRNGRSQIRKAKRHLHLCASCWRLF